MFFVAFNLNIVLKKTKEGSQLVAYYEKRNSFTHHDRLDLVNLIVDYLFAIKHKMSIKDFNEISNQIAMVFLKEDKASFNKARLSVCILNSVRLMNEFLISRILDEVMISKNLELSKLSLTYFFFGLQQ